EDGALVLDVVRLPLKRRQAHVKERVGLAVNAAALVVLAVETEGVEDLDLVQLGLVEAAVAPALAASGRTIREHELDVHGVVGELVLGQDVPAVGVQEAGLSVEAAAVPGVGVRAVEENL